MTSFRKVIATAAALAAGAAISTAASADLAGATIYGELIADAGTYSPIALGDSLQLDGCGSVFDYDDSAAVGTTVSLCNGVTDLSPFDFSWSVYQHFGGNSYSFLGYLPVDGATPVMTTGGVGDLIQTAGTYFMRLNVTLSPASATFALPGGDTGAFNPQDPLFVPGGNPDPNSDTKISSVALIVNPASVPEPAAALLLLPAMVVMARRQRKLRKQASC